MERNWLIRTAQNQILGPVAKQKLLEFIQKGALGMMDEVTSGNGYWFSLKEKDLVEKYLHGDLPQGYNPISESRSVVSRKDNPDKTTSINTAPANNNITQIIKLDLVGLNAAVPKAAPVLEDTKLPNQDDLEFPDIDLISSSVNASFKNGDQDLKAALTSAKIPMPIPKPSHVQREVPVSTSTEDIVLPADDDLAFPDMDDAKTSTKIDKENKIDLSHQYTRTVALDVEQAAEILPFEEEGDDLSFEVTRVVPISVTKEEIEKSLTEQTPGESLLKLDRGGVKPTTPVEMPAAKKERLQVQAQADDKKLLHDRKTKSSVAKGAALRDPSRENHKEAVEPQKRNDNYIFFILIILVLIIVAVFFYFKEILNKPLPV
jgi:hypothetical protein